MKTINTLIKESPVGSLPNSFKYAILSVFSGIVLTAISLLVHVLNNMNQVAIGYTF